MTTAELVIPFECINPPRPSSSYGDSALNFYPCQTSASAWSVAAPRRPVQKSESNLQNINEVTTSTWLNTAVEYAAEKFKGLLIQLIGSMFVPYREDLAKRLLELFRDAMENETSNPGISDESLYSFIKFINTSNIPVTPSVSLTADNNIYASWRTDKGHLFSVHFYPTGDTHFVVFIPDFQRMNKKTRISGVTTVDNLLKTTEANIRGWLLL